MRNFFRLIPFLQKRNSLGGIFFRTDIHMDHSLAPVFFEELLIDQIDMGDLQGLGF